MVSKWYTVSRDLENVKPYIKINPTPDINDCAEVKTGWEKVCYVNVTEFILSALLAFLKYGFSKEIYS